MNATHLLAVPEADYHADNVADRPTLSASIANVLCTSTPLHAWTKHPKLNPAFEREEKASFDIGTAAHALFLQGETNAVIVDAPDWRTKDAKEQRDAAHAAGLTPLLGKDWNRVQEMVEAMSRQLGRLDVDVPLFRDGAAEQTIVWDDDGVTCRARLDWIRDDLATIDDLKTTSKSANPASWCRTLFNIGADVQVAFYQRGVAALTGRTPEFRFVVVECTPPYALSVVSLAPDALELARRKVEYALAVWRSCLDDDDWPAYPTRVCWAEAPPWAEAQWLEREVLEDVAA